jgi:hypothetical protein
MSNKIKLVVALVLSISLAACGGGSSSSTNPLEKYVGTYTGCNNHQKSTTTISTTSYDQASVSTTTDIFENSDCTGANLGTHTDSSPVTVTYRAAANLPVSGIGSTVQNLTIDIINILLPPVSQSLTGSGVNGLCVNYTGGSYCYSTPPTSAVSSEGGFYMVGNLLYSLTFVNGVYQTDSVVLTKTS